MCVNKEILVRLVLFTYPELVHIVKHYLPEMRFWVDAIPVTSCICSAGGAVRAASDVAWPNATKCRGNAFTVPRVFFNFNYTIFILRLIFYVWFLRALHRCSRVWSLPTVPKLIAKKREEKEMKGKGDWQTGWNWPVCCVEDSFPVKRPSSDTSSSLSFTRYTYITLNGLCVI